MVSHVLLQMPGRVVGIATGYGLDGPGSNPNGGKIFRTCPDLPWGPHSLLYNGYRFFPGGRERPRRDADPSPPSGAVVKKEYRYNSIPPMGCTEPQCLYKGALYLSYALLQCPKSRKRNVGNPWSCATDCYLTECVIL